MDFDQAMDLLNRDERFKATVHAMNTLLIQKGVYTQEEFECCFCQWATAEAKKRNAKQRSAAITTRIAQTT